jgi:Holliday junction resolvasome RuvABC endonuclease subunit
MPEGASYYATIIGIDPGTDTLGVSILVFNVYTLEIITTEAFTLRGAKMIDKNGWIPTYKGERFARIKELKERLLSIFRKERPLFVVSESPFFNRLRPNAYGALIEILTSIHQAVYEYDPWVTLHEIDPPRIKKAVGAKGGSGKDAVRDGVLALAPELRYSGKVPLEELDEHAFDAIAAAVAQFRMYLEELCLKSK